MEQERFQTLVLEHLVRVTQELTEIKTDISELKAGQKRLEERMDRLEARQDRLEARQDRLEARQDRLEEQHNEMMVKLDLVHTQTVHLTEEVAALRKENKDQWGSIRALAELYGRHEIELNKLQKRPV